MAYDKTIAFYGKLPFDFDRVNRERAGIDACDV